MPQAYLKCIIDNHPPIEIGSDWTAVGRSPETNIRDSFCSRKQGKYIRKIFAKEVEIQNVSTQFNLKQILKRVVCW